MHISQLSKWTFPLQNIIQFSLSVEFFWKMIDLVQHLLKVHGFLCDSFNMHALNIHSQAPGEHQRPAKKAWPLLLMSSGSGDSIKSRKTSLIGLDGSWILDLLIREGLELLPPPKPRMTVAVQSRMGHHHRRA